MYEEEAGVEPEEFNTVREQAPIQLITLSVLRQFRHLSVKFRP
jgi:hypothetical protein